MVSWLPPYGWWVREHEHKTVLRGWDWALGAITLSHGVFTMPLSVWIVGSDWLALLLWLAASLFVAAGVGWAIVVDAGGFVFCRTWLCIPLTRKRLARNAKLEVTEDLGAPEGADFGRFVLLGDGDGYQFGERPNADRVKARLDDAVARRHNGPQ